jgi:tryptophan synthase alpha chain
MPDRSGLVLFLNAGDPSFEVTADLVLLLDEYGVDWLELAVPFPNVVTDGPVIRRSARRAIDAGADLHSTLSFVAAIRPQLSHLRIALMADWRHTVRALPLEQFLAAVKRCGSDGLLLHGVPPRARPGYYASAHALGLPVVATCFVSSSPAIWDEAAANATAYLYLVSRYGRGDSAPDPARLAAAVAGLRQRTAAPIAVGFGVETGDDVRGVWAAGADAAIVGSASVARVEHSLLTGGDPVDDMRALLDELLVPGFRPALSGS